MKTIRYLAAACALTLVPVSAYAADCCAKACCRGKADCCKDSGKDCCKESNRDHAGPHHD